jgi:hypothetical protein
VTDLTRQLQGREIAAVLCNGTTVLIQTNDGREVAIRWVDDSGQAIKGKPIVGSKGFRLNCRSFADLQYGPALSGIRR